MPPLNGLDLALIGIIGLSGLVGLIRGLIREVFSLVAWGVAVWVGLRYSREVAVYLERLIPLPSARIAAAFGILFFVCLVAAGLVAFILTRLVERTGLSGADRVAGLAFGLARGVLVAAVLVLLAAATPLPEERWWKESRLIPPFQSLALWLRDQIPPDYTKRLQSQIAPHR